MRIRKLSRQREKQLLAGMLISLNSEFPNNFGNRVKFEVLAWIVVVLLFATWVPALTAPTAMKVYLAAVGTATGFAFMWFAWRLAGARQWPALARCLDREKIEARLRELDA